MLRYEGDELGVSLLNDEAFVRYATRSLGHERTLVAGARPRAHR